MPLWSTHSCSVGLPCRIFSNNLPQANKAQSPLEAANNLFLHRVTDRSTSVLSIYLPCFQRNIITPVTANHKSRNRVSFCYRRASLKQKHVTEALSRFLPLSLSHSPPLSEQFTRRVRRRFSRSLGFGPRTTEQLREGGPAERAR